MLNPGPHVHSQLTPGVDTVGIYVENHKGKNRECVIWIRFDHRKLGEKENIPHLREDASISETCLPEENASHHVENQLGKIENSEGPGPLAGGCSDV